MARRPRLFLDGVPMHVVQRGNNRGPVFFDDRDRHAFRHLLLDGCVRLQCAVHAYVLMTNHVHLLLTPTHAGSTSQLMQWMGRRYVPTFNRRHNRTGTLWEGRFRASMIDSSRYFLACSRYIDQNPVRACMVPSATEYPWSSHARLARGVCDDLVTEHAEYRSLGSSPAARQAAYGALCGPPVDVELARGIRSALRRGDVLGSSSFVNDVHQRLRRPTRWLEHGGDRRSASFRQSAHVARDTSVDGQPTSTAH
jgi:putative transposase